MKELQIKAYLVEYLLKKNREITLGAEVPFQYGSRRADIISISSEISIAYEIKGSGDSTIRLDYQIDSYKKYFDYCFIVCEESNLKQIRKVIGKEVGLLVVSLDGSIKQVRKSKQFMRLNKEILASTLAVTLLKKYVNNKKLRSQHELCEALSKQMTLAGIKSISRYNLATRYSQLSNLLKRETLTKITPDDIMTITNRAPSALSR